MHIIENIMETNSKLHIITNSIKNIPYVLYLDVNNEDFPFLAYKKEESSWGETFLLTENVIEGETYDRPVRCSELFRLLLSMNPGTKFTLGKYETDLYYQIPYDRFSESSLPNTLLVTIPSFSGREEVDVFKDESPGPSLSSIKYMKVCDSDNWNLYPVVTEEITEMIDNQFNEIGIDNLELRSFGQYASDIKTGTRVLELISDTMYTDTLDFNDFQEKVVEHGVSCLAEVSVSYTIRVGNSSKNNKKTFIFKPFSYNDSVIVPNIIVGISNEVQAEYLNGVLRVIPKDSRIEECIIDSCTVTYGNI